MTLLSRRLMVVLLAVLLLAGLVPGAAHAASRRTVYVDDNGVANAATKGKCGKPNYNTIQAAVNDLSVKRVVVCKGTYVEQVLVERSLTLEGRSGAVIQAPASGADVIVHFKGPQKSRLTGFTITGKGSNNVNAGVRAQGFGGDDILYEPTQVTISNNRISDIQDTTDIRTEGIGIFIDEAQGDVSDNTVERYGYAGIVAQGGDVPNTSAQIDGNTVRGQGEGGVHAIQLGISIDETTADVEDNTVSGNYGNGPEGRGIGIEVIFAFAGSSIRDNEVKDNDVGVRLAPGSGAELRSNEIHNNAGNGIELLSTLESIIVENESSDNGDNGIYVAPGVQGNTIKGNTAENNGSLDIFDANGEPLVNTYTDNTCDTSNPDGLCEE